MIVGNTLFPSILALLLFAGPAVAQSPEQDGERFLGKTGNSHEEKILQALHTDADIDHLETPFEDFLHGLSADYQIPVILDESAADNNLDGQSRITKKLKGMSLDSALRIALSEFQCQHVVTSGVLIIMSQEKASELYMPRYYDCRKLIANMEGDSKENFEKVIKVAKTVIDPLSWDTRGGQGGAAEVDGLLFVLQNSDNHSRIEHLLGSLSRESLK